jgi:hypothetical protein
MKTQLQLSRETERERETIYFHQHYEIYALLEQKNAFLDKMHHSDHGKCSNGTIYIAYFYFKFVL